MPQAHRHRQEGRQVRQRGCRATSSGGLGAARYRSHALPYANSYCCPCTVHTHTHTHYRLLVTASGSAVPADCRVNEGEIDVDEAALTGTGWLWHMHHTPS
ncbi:hypothetical protein EON63_04685 [archaeon]|nr:MAG: hypothetical protein EON63_04685 [archaeon]